MNICRYDKDTQLLISVQFSTRNYIHVSGVKPLLVFNIIDIGLCLFVFGCFFLILPRSRNTIKGHRYETDFDHMVEDNFHFKKLLLHLDREQKSCRWVSFLVLWLLENTEEGL